MATKATAFNTSLMALGLKTADDFLRREAEAVGWASAASRLDWQSVDPYTNSAGHNWQERYLRETAPLRGELEQLMGHQSFVHVDPVEVNKWFAALPNIPIRFEERPIHPDLFYVGTYFALRDLHWAGDAEIWDPETNAEFDLNGRPAYRLGSSLAGVRFFNVGFGEGLPLVVIPTDNPRIQVMAIKSSMFEEFDLLSRMQTFRRLATPGNVLNRWGGVVLPYALVEKEVDIGKGKIVGLWTVSYLGKKVRIFEAGMFLRLLLCHEGPLAEGAAKMGFAKECMMVDSDNRPNYLLDSDFIFAFVDIKVENTPYVASWVPASEFANRRITLGEFGLIKAKVE